MIPHPALNFTSRRVTESDFLLEEFGSTIDQVEADVRLPERHPGIVVIGLLRLFGEGHRSTSNFDFGGFRGGGHFCQPYPIKFSAIKLHARICAGRILAEDAIEHDQRFKHSFPGAVADRQHTANDSAYLWEIGDWRCEQSRGYASDSLEEDQLQDRHQRPQLVEIQGGLGLDGFDESRKTRLRELIGDRFEISLSDANHTWHNVAIETANVRKLSDLGGWQSANLGMEKPNMVGKPAVVLGNGQFRCCGRGGKNRRQGFTKCSGAIRKYGRRASTGQPMKCGLQFIGFFLNHLCKRVCGSLRGGRWFWFGANDF